MSEQRRVRRVLALNLGSSSLKFAVFAVGAGERKLAGGSARTLDDVFDEVAKRSLGPIDAIGHRLVHGGVRHAAPVRIDPPLVTELRDLARFAPLHLPGEIDLVEQASRRAPGVPQVACFDTAFHRRMPEVAARLPLAAALWDEGVRRYGFHGLSYEAIVDPGVLVYLVRHHGYDADALDRAVNREAGLAGISGGTSDVRSLLAARSKDRRAALAIAVFCHSVRKHIALRVFPADEERMIARHTARAIEARTA